MMYLSEYKTIRLTAEFRLLVYHAWVMPPAHNDN